MNILISPLNWGLGHATRIVPIIKILAQQHKITIAADGTAREFLLQEFPEMEILIAPTLTINYHKNKDFAILKYLLLLPTLTIFFVKNRLWIKKITHKRHFDLIIADNRFGFFSTKIRSIFITHQINIQFDWSIAQKIATWFNKKNIDMFDECWIPENINGQKLSGILSDYSKIKIPCRKIGILTRFAQTQNLPQVPKYEIVAIISGVEPQRSIFENIIIEITKKLNCKTLIVQGLPKQVNFKKNGNISIINHLASDELQSIILQSEIIICRSGYSSIMDLSFLKKTAILIPTPFQPEQEFLAKYLQQQNIFYTCNQDDFSSETINKFKEIKNLMQKNIENLKFDVFNELNISE